MSTKFNKTAILFAGLFTALVLPGLASAEDHRGHSLKYQAREQSHRYDRGNYREHGYRQEHQRHRHQARHHGDRHYGWRPHYRDHRHHDDHHVRYYEHRDHHDGLSINGLYLTPHLGLSLHLGH